MTESINDKSNRKLHIQDSEPNESVTNCEDCIWHKDEWHCTMNCYPGNGNKKIYF